MTTKTRTNGAVHNGVVDVSGVTTERVQQYAEETDALYIERKGGRTFLVTE